MGSASSSNESPSLLRFTFTKIHGEASVLEIKDKMDWIIVRMCLYQVPNGIISHMTRAAHYFLLFDVEFGEQLGHIICHFTEDGVKHLEFHSSRTEAIFKTFENKYLTKKMKLLKYYDVQGKAVAHLVKIFLSWEKDFNLVVSNCRHFTKFIHNGITKS